MISNTDTAVVLCVVSTVAMRRLREYRLLSDTLECLVVYLVFREYGAGDPITGCIAAVTLAVALFTTRRWV